MDNKTPFRDVVANPAKAAGTPIVLKDYVGFQLGELHQGSRPATSPLEMAAAFVRLKHSPAACGEGVEGGRPDTDFMLAGSVSAPLYPLPQAGGEV